MKIPHRNKKEPLPIFSLPNKRSQGKIEKLKVEINKGFHIFIGTTTIIVDPVKKTQITSNKGSLRKVVD